MTSAYVPEDQPAEVMTRFERLVRMAVVVLLAVAVAVLLVW